MNDYILAKKNNLGFVVVACSLVDYLMQCCGSGSVWICFILVSRSQVARYQPKSWKISKKINQNHKNIIHFFKNDKLMFNRHKYFLDFSRIRSRIRIKMKRIRNTDGWASQAITLLYFIELPDESTTSCDMLDFKSYIKIL